MWTLSRPTCVDLGEGEILNGALASRAKSHASGVCQSSHCPSVHTCETLILCAGFVQAIACMLGEFGHKRATFLAHSYGTFVLSWVIRRRPDLVAKVGSGTHRREQGVQHGSSQLQASCAW